MLHTAGEALAAFRGIYGIWAAGGQACVLVPDNGAIRPAQRHKVRPGAPNLQGCIDDVTTYLRSTPDLQALYLMCTSRHGPA